MKPEAFLTAHRLFRREELAAVLQSRGRARATVDAHLARWLRQGRIERVKQGVFARLDAAGPSGPADPDFAALASRLAPDAAVAHHTALEVHGFAESLFERFTFVTWTKTKPLTFRGRRFVPVRPRVQLLTADRGEGWIERVERAGTELRVTSLERTVADVLDRPDLSGGIEEVWRSLSSVNAVDPGSLERYVELLGSKTLTAKVGFFLETHREALAVPPGLIERLRANIPMTPCYMERGRTGRLVSRWSLIVPEEILSPEQAGVG